MENQHQLRLRTPEQVAEDLGAISPHTVRRLCRDGAIEYTRLARGKFALTDEQVDGMLKHLAKAPEEPQPRPAETVFPTTSRSKAIRRTRSRRN